MSQKLVNLCVKEPEPLTNYRYFRPMVITDSVIKSEIECASLNFHIPMLIEEVKQLPRKTKNEYKKIARTFLTTAASFLLLPLKSMAASPHSPGTVLPSKAEGIPPEILDLLLKLLVIAVGSAVVFAAILLVAAGVKRMLGNRKESSEWTTDIIKGLLQVLVAVPVVFLLYYVVNMLFSGNGWFVSPF